MSSADPVPVPVPVPGLGLAALAALAACGPSTAPPSPPVANVPATIAAAAPPDAAPADADDCILDLDAIASRLDHRAPGVTTAVAPRRADRRLTEAITLADGTRVEFSVGGCAHFAWELTYAVAAGRIGTTADQRLDAAAALLQRTPIADDLGTTMADRIRARPRPTTAAPPWEIDCGDAICHVDATAGAAGALVLVVRYDFPL